MVLIDQMQWSLRLVNNTDNPTTERNEENNSKDSVNIIEKIAERVGWVPTNQCITHGKFDSWVEKFKLDRMLSTRWLY